ncbi:MAG: tryptophan-rich sensory protein [Firmicutes bacterium]|nr:tryptophan-rich sensory protein [Bacillota bacterium]
MSKIHWPSLLISIAIAEAVGALSGLLAGDIRAVYSSLVQPPLSPPGWLFLLVWTVLFALMGIAAYLVYHAPVEHSQKSTALRFYAAQLVVNFFWPIIFFRFQLFGWAVAVIILLVVLVIITMVLFARINRTAMYLLIPYLLWLLFATYLNIGVAILN